MHDLGLAILHHLLVFGLVATLMAQRVMLRGPTIDVRRLAGLDRGYGVTAGLVLIVGVGRVIWGGKGWAFYEANPFFWAKVATFLAIALISIGPTLMIARWAKAAAAEPGFRPPAEQIARTRRLTGVQALLLIPLLAFAAAMARWPF